MKLTPYRREALQRIADAAEAGLDVRAAFPTRNQMPTFLEQQWVRCVSPPFSLSPHFGITDAGRAALASSK